LLPLANQEDVASRHSICLHIIPNIRDHQTMEGMYMALKPVQWVGSTQDDLADMPEDVKDEFGHALFQAQEGKKSDKAKPLKGFKGAGVLEIVESDAGGTYRAVYTVIFKEVIFVLHVFKKKSTHKIATPKQDVDLIKHRLQLAEQMYDDYCGGAHGKRE
jgi:phage-related protein